ncbi:hypothetical protein P0W64_19925 [Tsukamurella sp. 8F]|uniref:hypothetical protein n=1 Tax=unclassified Tsukamurella TaxID=2633480 RepID=UPI0023B9F720|nr:MULTISPECIES: hypothetical protein [unclassified Tsukamurella]MDF0531815.1 hypothetical protein [Tsukamurella sp. 8J]MDF0589057.1 hypothetical protein [Tsukamurella sp. 8F]
MCLHVLLAVVRLVSVTMEDPHGSERYPLLYSTPDRLEEPGGGSPVGGSSVGGGGAGGGRVTWLHLVAACAAVGTVIALVATFVQSASATRTPAPTTVRVPVATSSAAPAGATPSGPSPAPSSSVSSARPSVSPSGDAPRRSGSPRARGGQDASRATPAKPTCMRKQWVYRPSKGTFEQMELPC